MGLFVRSTLLAALVLGPLALHGLALAAPVAPAHVAVPTLSFEKLRLANGFELILVEDHRLPLVAFNLWVHAGPRNEVAGQTGFAHLFEHLMFAGTRHIPRGEADKLLESAGATDSNGSTDFDRTNYFFTLPSNQLELGLWIKSDMLGYMIDEVDSVALANQQDVVRNERRQTTENQPYGVVTEAEYQALYPEGHPYRAVVIGSHADIQSIKLDDVKAFARRYYRPNNATLVLAGDFKPAEAKRLLQKYFGSLKAGEPVPPVAVPMPQLTAERRLVVTDQVELPRLTQAWHTPAGFAPGDADLDVAAHILGGGKASRLHQALVYERQLAQSVQASQGSAQLSSVFELEVLARKGQSLAEIEAVVDEQVAALAATAPSAEEVQRALIAVQTQLLARMEKLSTLADQLNAYNQMTGEPGYIGQDLARYQAVTPESVRAAVARWLGKNSRVVVQALPGEKLLAAEVPTPAPPSESSESSKSEREALNEPEDWRGQPPAAGPAQVLKLPQGKQFTLANGLTVIHLPKPGLPLVSATLSLRAGQSANAPDQPGLASFTAAMLQEGAGDRSAQQIADQLADLGLALSSSSGLDDARIEFSGLTSSFAPGLALVADMALRPAFAPTEVERQKLKRLGALAQQREQAPAVAAVLGRRMVYGVNHPLGWSSLGDEAAIQSTDAAALRAFWLRHYRPDQAALVVAGDVSESELRSLAQSLFGGWAKPAARVPARLPARLPAPTRASATRVVLVDQPGAPQTALNIVSAGPRAGLADEAASEVMNAALGGLFTSRINKQLREVKGYTYGIHSGFTRGRESGQFSIAGSVRADVTGAALKDLFAEIDGVRAQPLPADELKKARNAELLTLPGLFDTNHIVAGSYAHNWVLGLPMSSLTKWPAQLGAVTAASAFKAAQSRVDPNELIVIAVGDKASVLPQLEALGRKPLALHDASGARLK